MNSTAINWQTIESFIGYGRRDAPVVFIGLEEGLADESALENDLIRRSQFEPIMDLREAHRNSGYLQMVRPAENFISANMAPYVRPDASSGRGFGTDAPGSQPVPGTSPR